MQQQALTFNDMQQINNELSKLNVQDCSTPIEGFNALLKYWIEMHSPAEEPKLECDEHDILPVWNKWINRAIPLNSSNMFINHIKKMYDELHNSPKCVWYIHEFTAILKFNDCIIPKRKYVIMTHKLLDYKCNSDVSTVDSCLKSLLPMLSVLEITHVHTTVLEDYVYVLCSAFNNIMRTQHVDEQYDKILNTYTDRSTDSILYNVYDKNGTLIPSSQCEYSTKEISILQYDGVVLPAMPYMFGVNELSYISFNNKFYTIAFDSHDSRYDEFYKQLQEFIRKCEEYKKDDYKLYYEENC